MYERSAVRPRCQELKSWDEIVQRLGRFPAPSLSFDEDGDVMNRAWIFRGVSSEFHPLEPSIERDLGDVGWSSLEVKVIEEFKSRARMYIAAPLIPEDELSWLALMQHYAIPTRLLDFTLSPFAALYFAIRSTHRGRRTKEKGRKHGSPKPENSQPITIWAVDSQAINSRFLRVIANAARSVRRQGRHHAISLNPEDALSERDMLRSNTSAIRQHAEEALVATGPFRAQLKRSGCVCMAVPPTFNPRLATQQGVFLLNCTEDLTLDQSLEQMMRSSSGWCEAFDIRSDLLPEIENQLFQMNIHDQSLFPDMEGLAGLIRQKIRLHWS